MKVAIRVFLFLFSVGILQAQETQVWNTYQAKQEQGVSSTNLRMDLVDAAPINGYDFLFYIKIKYRVTKESDFPIGNKLKKLYRIKDEIYTKMQSVSDSKYVGSFMYDGSRFEYYYVKDATNIESHIDKLFRNKFRGEKYDVYVKSDPAWDLYLNFLYPNEEMLNFMSNRDTVIQLKNAGDNVLAVRNVDHFAGFTSVNDMNLFEEAIKKLAYKVVYKKPLKSKKYSHEIKFSRDNSVTLENAMKFTTELIKLTKEFNGFYDGWETLVIKKKEE